MKNPLLYNCISACCSIQLAIIYVLYTKDRWFEVLDNTAECFAKDASAGGELEGMVCHAVCAPPACGVFSYMAPHQWLIQEGTPC